MPLLERVVRPSETPQIFAAPISTLARVPDPPDDQVVTIGGGKGELFAMRGNYSENKSWDYEYRESARWVDIYRIFNPDDKDQYLDIAQARKSEFDGGKGGTETRQWIEPDFIWSHLPQAPNVSHIEVLDENVRITRGYQNE